MAYVAITIEGGLFPADLLDRLAAGVGDGQRAEDFGVSGRLGDEVQSAFSDARTFWDFFTRRRAYSHESLTTLTREAWMIPLLERLDYRLTFQRTAAQAGGESYALSHRAGDSPDAPPVHIVALDQSLDRRGAAPTPWFRSISTAPTRCGASSPTATACACCATQRGSPAPPTWSSTWAR
jgi:hypothetical protein